VAALGVGLGQSLGECCFALVQSGQGHIVGGFFGVEVLLRDQFIVKKGLSAVEVQFFLLEIRLALSDVCLGGLFCRKEAGDVCAGGGDGGLLGGDGGLGLNAFNRGKCGAGLDVIALLYIQVGDATEGGGSDVDVGLGFDLARAVDDRGEVLTDSFAGCYLGNLSLPVEDGTYDDTGQNESTGCAWLRLVPVITIRKETKMRSVWLPVLESWLALKRFTG
jgi:hypothetical protein